MTELDLSAVGIEALIQEIEKRFNIIQSKYNLLREHVFHAAEVVRLTPERTHLILLKNDLPGGLLVSYIVKLYSEIGIETHDRYIYEQIKELISIDLVFQINPQNRRGKRFRSLPKKELRHD